MRRVRDVPRDHDLLLLEMLHLRRKGVGACEIARRTGEYQQEVSRRTNEVLKADLAESGEPAAKVRRAYW